MLPETIPLIIGLLNIKTAAGATVHKQRAWCLLLFFIIFGPCCAQENGEFLHHG